MMKRAVFAALTVCLLAPGSWGHALADQCADRCRAAHNQCRIETKGASPVCDSRMQACMDGCRPKR